MNLSAQGWADIQIAQPIDPRTCILNVQVGAVQGTFTRATNFLQTAWGAPPPAVSLTGNNTKLVSLDTTDAATTAEAAQWTATHQMVNVAATIPSVLSKVVFLRAGKIWDNQVELAFSGTCNNVQLSFRDNTGTSGIFLNGSTGGVPVFSFGNGITSNQVLHVTLMQPGIYSVVIIVQVSTTWTAFEMEWIVLP